MPSVQGAVAPGKAAVSLAQELASRLRCPTFACIRAAVREGEVRVGATGSCRFCGPFGLHGSHHKIRARARNTGQIPVPRERLLILLHT